MKDKKEEKKRRILVLPIGKKTLTISLSLVVFAICGLFVGSALAFTLFSVPVIKMALFGQTFEDSVFELYVESVKVKRKRVIIELVLLNTDVDPHGADVIVSCYDALGDYLAELIIATGDVPAGDPVGLLFEFTDIAHGVNIDTFATVDIQVTDTS